MNTTRLMQIVPGLALAAVIAGCGESDSDGPVPTPTPVAESRVRIIHGSPDAPPVDVLVDGAIVLSDVPYLAASDYLSLPAGMHNVQVRAAGTTTVVIDADVDLDADIDYTVLATDFVASITPVILVDDRTLPSAGSAKVRIGHGAPSAPNVDVFITEPDGGLVDPVLVDVPFKAFADYLTVPAGDYRVRVTPTGTTDVVIDTGTVTLEAGYVITAIAVDAAEGGAPFSVEAYVDAAPSSDSGS